MKESDFDRIVAEREQQSRDAELARDLAAMRERGARRRGKAPPPKDDASLEATVRAWEMDRDQRKALIEAAVKAGEERAQEELKRAEARRRKDEEIAQQREARAREWAARKRAAKEKRKAAGRKRLTALGLEHLARE